MKVQRVEPAGPGVEPAEQTVEPRGVRGIECFRLESSPLAHACGTVGGGRHRLAGRGAAVPAPAQMHDALRAGPDQRGEVPARERGQTRLERVEQERCRAGRPLPVHAPQEQRAQEPLARLPGLAGVQPLDLARGPHVVVARGEQRAEELEAIAVAQLGPAIYEPRLPDVRQRQPPHALARGLGGYGFGERAHGREQCASLTADVDLRCLVLEHEAGEGEEARTRGARAELDVEPPRRRPLAARAGRDQAERVVQRGRFFLRPEDRVEVRALGLVELRVLRPVPFSDRECPLRETAGAARATQQLQSRDAAQSVTVREQPLDAGFETVILQRLEPLQARAAQVAGLPREQLMEAVDLVVLDAEILQRLERLAPHVGGRVAEQLEHEPAQLACERGAPLGLRRLQWPARRQPSQPAQFGRALRGLEVADVRQQSAARDVFPVRDHRRGNRRPLERDAPPRPDDRVERHRALRDSRVQRLEPVEQRLGRDPLRHVTAEHIERARGHPEVGIGEHVHERRDRGGPPRLREEVRRDEAELGGARA